jgi:hypothetical protein
MTGRGTCRLSGLEPGGIRINGLAAGVYIRVMLRRRFCVSGPYCGIYAKLSYMGSYIQFCLKLIDKFNDKIIEYNYE